MKNDRDLVAQWAGEELAASSCGTAAARAAHAARNRFYLDMLRGEMPTTPPPQGTAKPFVR